jgi:parallel beta-helix repeat protein
MIGIGVFEGNHRHVRDEARKQGNNNLIEYNESSYNNYAHFDYHNQTAGIKNLVGTAVTIRGNYIHHNDARGIWLDVGTVGSVIEDNVIVSNSFSGIVVELGFDTVIRSNLVADNGKKMAGGVHGYQIVIQVSEQSDVFANTIIQSATSGGGIVIEFAQRQSGRFTRNNYIHHNTIHAFPNKISAALYCYAKGLSQEAQDNFFGTDSNRFDHNLYHVNNTEADTLFEREGKKLSLNQFREFGQETSGELRHAH